MNGISSLPQIDTEVMLRDGEGEWIGPYVVVEHGSDHEFILRMDANSNDASSSDGMNGIDWEYVYVSVKYDDWKRA